MYRGLVFAVLFATTGSLQAQIPHTFQGGQPARAAEVNQNFAYLESRIRDLDRGGTGTFPDPLPFIDIMQTDSPVGAEITIGEHNYVIMQYEIPRFDTDEIWLLRVPARKPISESEGSVIASFVTVYGTYRGTSDFYRRHWRMEDGVAIRLNDFDAVIDEGYTFSAMNIPTGRAHGQVLTNEFKQDIYLTIELGPQTYVEIFYWTPWEKREQFREPWSADLSNFVSVYPPTPDSGGRETVRQYLQELVSHVWLERKP